MKEKLKEIPLKCQYCQYLRIYENNRVECFWDYPQPSICERALKNLIEVKKREGVKK